MSYTPGLIVEQSTEIQKLRELPIPGRALVKVGDRVTADQTVLVTQLPGELVIVRVAEKLGCTVEQALKSLRVKEGQIVRHKDLLCELRTLFGLLNEQVTSPAEGTIEYILPSTAHIGIRLAPKALEVKSYIAGTISSVEEGKRLTVTTTGTLVQGIFGVGGERLGTLLPLGVSPETTVTRDDLTKLQLKGKVLAGGSSVSVDALRFAAEQGATGIITGSITSAALREILGRDLGVSMTGDEDLPYSLIITEGFGQLPMSKRTLDVLRSVEGKLASINGATQVRAGAMRPELIVSDHHATSLHQSAPTADLKVGSDVRCIRAPYFGQRATITALPVEPREVDSGATVRVAELRLSDGTIHAVPRANIELV